MAQRGRPRGVKNAPNPQKDAVREVFHKPVPRKRAPEEVDRGVKHFSLKLDIVSHAVLELQAYRRHVPLAWLMNDILNLWLAASTDYGQTLFKEVLPPNARAAKTPERYPGYIESLGFAPATPQAPLAPEPPQVYESEAVPQHILEAVGAPPNSPPSKSLTDLQQPYRHPLTQGPVSYPHPAPAIPSGAGVFDPEAYNAGKPVTGHGSAAQEATEGNTPQAELPPMNPDMEKWLAYYKVNPEDVR